METGQGQARSGGRVVAQSHRHNGIHVERSFPPTHTGASGEFSPNPTPMS